MELKELVMGVVATLSNKYCSDDNKNIMTWIISSGNVLYVYGKDYNILQNVEYDFCMYVS